MAIAGPARATVDDLLRVRGKAELIGGRIVEFPPGGFATIRAAGRISRAMEEWAERRGGGFAFAGMMGFMVPELSSGRESFCPDAAFFDGPMPARPMRFLDAPPTFAVEVRSEGDHGPAADREIADKRADYFEAGTLVVWDVDPVAKEIRSYRSDAPDSPTISRPGDSADAEPAVPGWRVAVDRVFS